MSRKGKEGKEEGNGREKEGKEDEVERRGKEGRKGKGEGWIGGREP